MQRKMRLRHKNPQNVTARLQRKKGTLLEIKQQLIFILKIIGVALIIITGIFLWQNNAIGNTLLFFENSKNKISVISGMVVKDLRVEGREKTKASDILKIVNTKRGASIYQVDPESIKAKLEKLPWIRSATVQRRLSGIVYIRLSEKQPAALWQKSKKLYMIDDKGNVIDKVDPKLAKDLIILIGSKAPAEAANLIAHLNNFPKIHAKVRAATYVGDRRWDLLLKNKVKIQLPENNLAHALANLHKMDMQHSITDGRVLKIDMRLLDRSFLEVMPAAGREEKT